MSARRGAPRARVIRNCALLLLLCALAGCSPPFTGGRIRYIPADAGVDPNAEVRQRAEQFYQDGLVHEQRREWRAALASYEQARLWDPDNRQDIIARTGQVRTQLAVAAVPPAPPAAPTATPPVVGAAPATDYPLFRSKIAPYVIAYPPGWTPPAGDVRVGQLRLDIFVAPPSTDFVTNVNVIAVPLAAGITDEQYYSLNMRQLRARLAVRELAPRTVDGVVARRITYDGLGYAVTQAIFVDGQFGWVVTLATAAGTGDDWLALFDEMLASFHVVDLAAQTP